MADPITSYLVNLGFPHILLWMLSFAALYGLMTQAEIPKAKAPRALIAISAAFFVIIAAPAALLTVISNMAQSLILVVMGILVMITFLEVAGLKHRGKLSLTEKGVAYEHEGMSYMHKYGKIFAIIFIIIAVLVFIGAGGLGLLGFQIALRGMPVMTILFFIVIIGAIMWMIFEKEKK